VIDMPNLTEFRKQKDWFFENDQHSPLDAEQRESFPGLSYYHENQQLRFEVQVKPFEDHIQIEMQTSTGNLQQYTKYGRFQFDVDGEGAELTIYTSADGGAFVPFVDATSGKETYGAGRYMELEHLGGNKYLVDFNLAYNPWCAYSPFFSCPIPSQENRLSVAIQAGEKNFQSPGH
jgi:uncharacterized protein (DUF1684 family)